MIILFMYCTSFSLIAGQYVLGDIYGITLTSWDGTPIKSGVLEFVDVDAINEVTLNIVNVNDTRNSTLDAVTQSFELGLTIGFDLLLILTGTVLFNMIYLLGGPGTLIIIGPLVILYAILLARAIIAYLRGV